MALESRSGRTTPRENTAVLHRMGKVMFSSVKDIRDSTSFDQMSAIMLSMANEEISKKTEESEDEALAREARIAVQLRIRTFIQQYEISKEITIMVRLFASIKQFIAWVQKKSGRNNELVAAALLSPTPGTALRASMQKHENDPKVLGKLLRGSRKHGLRGRP